MKLRYLLLIAVGVALGLKISEKLREDDLNVLHGPQRARSEVRPRMNVVSTQFQRLTEAATGKSLEAIRRVRGQIRDRLGDEDVAAWN